MNFTSRAFVFSLALISASFAVGCSDAHSADVDGGPLPAIRESDAVQWAIGPEGGFTEAEIASLKAAGFRPVALGRATLRFDTAALAALALTAQARLVTPQQGKAG